MSSGSEKKRLPVIPSRFRLLNEDGTEGVLLGKRCRACGEHFFGDVVFCRRCSSTDLEPVELSKHGTLYSYTIVRVPPAGWPGDVPYALGQVELPEGPHVLSEVVDCPFERLRVGMALELAPEVGGEDAEGNEVVVYKWRPAEQS
jgi:uncharacterized OB-fold protein